MKCMDLSIEGAKIFFPKVFCDERGFFYESFRKPVYESMGVIGEFLQDNHSYSKEGTLRGMHFQLRLGQAKVINVVAGRIYDVIVDIRKESPTYKKWVGIELDESDHKLLYVPAGCAHGFYALKDTHVLYKVSSLFDPSTEMNFHYADKEIDIHWPFIPSIISERDRMAPSFQEACL